MSDPSRRRFLRRALALGAAGALPPPLVGLARCSVPAQGQAVPPRHAGEGEGGYGPIAPGPGTPELALPRGFRAVRLSVSGEPMSDGAPTPDQGDGMAAFALPNGNIRLIRNHEVPGPGLIGRADLAYDERTGGGTTSLEVSVTRAGEVVKVRDFVSLGGTLTNCAGGPTPWGTWITCEETTQGVSHGWTRSHGYVFEVPVAAEGQVAAVPLPALGRFTHEAVAVDPATGIVYLTEDMRVIPRLNRLGSGFYRFLPGRRERLADGGRLQALAVEGLPRLATYRDQVTGRVLPARWVDIPEPDPAAAEDDVSAVLRQGIERGAAVFARLEGCWYGNGVIYFTATSGGDARRGQVWQYRPRGEARGDLTLIFESPGPEFLNAPDNITVSPRRRGLLICEDNGEGNHLRGITPTGAVFDFARNLEDTREFAGVCFSPDGETLFVNIQRTGAGRSVTYAIRGPWARGVL